MILQTAYQDTNGADMRPYWDAMRSKNYNTSFESVKDYVQQNEGKLQRRRRPLRKWQWVMAVLLPVMVLLACTKTESAEPIGQTLSFVVPESSKQAVKRLTEGNQVVVSPVKDRTGYLSYTVFLQGNQSAASLQKNLQNVKGVEQLSLSQLTTQVKESLLSRLSYKIFQTHIDATQMSDETLQQSIASQLKEKGIPVNVRVVRDEEDSRHIELIPTAGATDYSITLSIDDGLNKTEIEEVRKSNPDPLTPDVGSMTDAQVREYIRKEHGAHLNDNAIEINRTTEDVTVTIKEGEGEENTMVFKRR